MEVLQEFLKEYKTKRKEAEVKIGVSTIVLIASLVLGLCAFAVLSELYILYNSPWMLWCAILGFLLLAVSVLILGLSNRNSRSIDKARERIEKRSKITRDLIEKNEMDNHTYIDLLLQEIDVYERRKEGSNDWMKWIIPILLSVVLTYLSKESLTPEQIVIAVIAMIAICVCVVTLFFNNQRLQPERFLIDEVRSALRINKSQLDD